MVEKVKKTTRVALEETTLQTVLRCMEKMRQNNPDEIAEWSDLLTGMHVLNQATRPELVIVELPVNIFRLVTLGFSLLGVLATDSGLRPFYRAYKEQKDPSRN